MINKTISIPEEVNNKLKTEENASALITKLLIQHYKYNIDSIDELKERLDVLNKNKQELLSNLDMEQEQIIAKKEILEKQIELTIKEKEDKEKKTLAKEESIMKTFKDFAGRDITREELNEYQERLIFEKGFNLFRYLDEKGITY